MKVAKHELAQISHNIIGINPCGSFQLASRKANGLNWKIDVVIFNYAVPFFWCRLFWHPQKFLPNFLFFWGGMFWAHCYGPGAQKTRKLFLAAPHWHGQDSFVASMLHMNMGGSINGGIPSHHPLLDGIFSTRNHPAIGKVGCQWTNNPITVMPNTIDFSLLSKAKF